VAVIGIIVARTRYHHPILLEISSAPTSVRDGTIYIDGGVASPGYYNFHPDDTVDNLIRAAGGVVNPADVTALQLHVTFPDEDRGQKVDINHADVWLLQALPGIGETLARRIVDYRLQNGPFQDTSGLLKISGIGKSEYERIRNLITITEN
jgi:competence protein ComEA